MQLIIEKLIYINKIEGLIDKNRIVFVLKKSLYQVLTIEKDEKRLRRFGLIADQNEIT